jgi:hypothetical protein
MGGGRAGRPMGVPWEDATGQPQAGCGAGRAAWVLRPRGKWDRRGSGLKLVKIGVKGFGWPEKA